MVGCQNYGPFLGTLNIRGRIIIGTQKGTIILTTNQMFGVYKAVSSYRILLAQHTVAALSDPALKCHTLDAEPPLIIHLLNLV